MFSNNGKISAHQAIRLLIMDLFTGACLFLPMALPRVAGNGGLLSAVLGIALIGFEGMLMIKAAQYKTCENSFSSKINIRSFIQWFLGLRCLASYIFLMSLFVQVLSDTFLYTMPKWMIVGAMAVVLFYSGTKGIEVRARLSEILFYLSLIPIVFIGLFSLPEAEWSRLLVFDDVTLRGIFEGTLITWILMSPLEWLFYIQKDIIIQKHLKKIFYSALIIGGSMILFFYGTCQAVLGVNGMISEQWPTTILMQIIKIPGGFLSRQDGLMLSFWIFAMYISLSGALMHTVELWNMEKENQKKWWILMLAAGGGVVAGFKGMQKDFLDTYFYGMIVTGIFIFWLIPFIRCIREYFRKNKAKWRWLQIVLIVFGASFLSGCENHIQLENRSFSMALGIDLEENGMYNFTYAFADLKKLTGNGSGEKKKPVSIKAKNLEEAEELFNQMSDKIMDYGQIKVLILGENLTEHSVELERIVKEVKHKQEMARTIFVCVSKTSAKDVVFMDEKMDISVGMYLEKLLQNNNKDVILNEWIQNCSSQRLPQIVVLNNMDESCKIE